VTTAGRAGPGSDRRLPRFPSPPHHPLPGPSRSYQAARHRPRARRPMGARLLPGLRSPRYTKASATPRLGPGTARAPARLASQSATIYGLVHARGHSRETTPLPPPPTHDPHHAAGRRVRAPLPPRAPGARACATVVPRDRGRPIPSLPLPPKAKSCPLPRPARTPVECDKKGEKRERENCPLRRRLTERAPATVLNLSVLQAPVGQSLK
jgi:hypothetical protein